MHQLTRQEVEWPQYQLMNCLKIRSKFILSTFLFCYPQHILSFLYLHPSWPQSSCCPSGRHILTQTPRSSKKGSLSFHISFHHGGDPFPEASQQTYLPVTLVRIKSCPYTFSARDSGYTVLAISSTYRGDMNAGINEVVWGGPPHPSFQIFLIPSL